MQNVQNTEIQRRVINLVDTYRTQIGSDESDNYKVAYEYWKIETDKQIKEQEKECVNNITTSVLIPEGMMNKLKVNEQLLGHFYLKSLGARAKEDVALQLFANYYDGSVLSSHEENFLATHFKELVDYIISTPCNNMPVDWDEKDIYIIPQEVLDVACERMQIPPQAIVYNPFAGFAQFATKLNNCMFVCEDSYSSFRMQGNRIDNDYDVSAWTEIILAANGLKNNICHNDNKFSYDAIMSYIPFLPKSYGRETAVVEEMFMSYLCSIFLQAYNSLKKHGKMGLILPNETMWKNGTHSYLQDFWEKIILEGALSEIIQLPSVMSFNCHHNYSLVIITKKHNSFISMIDARFASNDISNHNIITIDDLSSSVEQFLGKSDLKSFKALKNEERTLIAKSGGNNFIKSLDIERVRELETNGGKDSETGLRKLAKITASDLHVELLVPQVYVVEKPSENDAPIELSKLCSVVRTRIRDINYDLPKDTAWIKSKNLFYIYKGALNLTSLDIEKSDCPNIPPRTDDFVYIDKGELESEFPDSQKTAMGKRVLEYRECFFLDGKKDVVLYKSDNQEAKLAIVQATGKPYAIEKDIIAFVPNDGCDAFHLYILLSMPLVYRQIQAIEKFGVYSNLHNVLVPTDKRIIKDAEKKLLREEKDYKAHEEKLQTMKTEYINEVRMRKHDMGQYIFELVNIEDLMRYYVENREKNPNFCQELETLLDNFQSSLGELSTLLDNLSKEEQFGDPEILNIDTLLSQMNNRYKADGFIIDYSLDESSFKRYNRKLHRVDSVREAMIEAQLQADEAKRAEREAIIEAQLQADEAKRAEREAMIEAQLQADEAKRAEREAIIEAQLQADEAKRAEREAMIEAQLQADEAKRIAREAMIEAQLQADEAKRAEREAMIEAQLQEYDDENVLENALFEESSIINRPSIGENDCSKGISTSKKIYNIPSLYIARNDILRLVSNIIDNARKHGFTDSNRKDYEIKVTLSIDVDNNMYQIDFRNNGNPLPEGMNKMRYGIKGEKAGKTAGTGLGGNYVKSFVEHYGGDYDIFMEDGWTVVRICLPIK